MAVDDDTAFYVARRFILRIYVARRRFRQKFVDERHVEQEFQHDDDNGQNRKYQRNYPYRKRQRGIADKRQQLQKRADNQKYADDFRESDKRVSRHFEIFDCAFVRPAVGVDLVFDPFLGFPFFRHARFARADVGADVRDCVHTVIDGVFPYLFRYFHDNSPFFGQFCPLSLFIR